MTERPGAPSYIKAYERVLRAAAAGPVYVSRSTNLDGERKTVSWHLVRRMERDGTVKRANVVPDRVILTGGRHYLENVYHEHLLKDENSPDFKADSLVHMLRKLGLKSAVFLPENQVVGLSMEDWRKIPGVPGRARKK